MLEKLIREPLSLTYLTGVVDISNFVKRCEKEGMRPKEIIKHLKQCGKTAETAIDTMLNDMEMRHLASTVKDR